MGIKRNPETLKPTQKSRFRSLPLRFRLVASIGMWLALIGGHATLAEEEIVVVASIKPIHSIVSAIMEGVGEPHLIMKGAASPHTFNLRPSDARALDRSDVVFQVGHAMEASLADIMWTLATRAEIVSLSHATKLVKLSYREGGLFGSHDHAYDHSHESAREHDSLSASDRSELGHDDHFGHDARTDHHADSQSASLLEDAVDETFDMHIWLDPRNGRVIAEVIAAVLAENDVKNKGTYSRNLQKFLADMDGLETELRGELDALHDRAFIAYHDAYHYFEDRFNLLAVGSAVVVPGRSAGARRILELRQTINELNVVCVFSEPQFDEQLIGTIVEGTEAKVGVLDPLGANLEDGKTLYPTLLRNMGNSFNECLEPVS